MLYTCSTATNFSPKRAFAAATYSSCGSAAFPAAAGAVRASEAGRKEAAGTAETKREAATVKSRFQDRI